MAATKNIFLQMNRNGTRCTLTVMKNYIPEEGERGEYFIVDLPGADVDATATPCALTTGAGRVMDGGGGCLLNADGSIAVMSANLSLDRPITTTCNLWVLRADSTSGKFPSAVMHGDAALEPITTGKDIVEFGWVSGCTDTLWATWVVDGVHCETGVLAVPARATAGTPTWTLLPAPYTSYRCSGVVSLGGNATGADVAVAGGAPVDTSSLFFTAESATVYPQLVHLLQRDQAVVVALPHRSELLDVFNELRYYHGRHQAVVAPLKHLPRERFVNAVLLLC
eukprot:m.287374 g.287374  ORF g.287374 m.287374 type:complete len:281 (-) comp19946_c0_seq21:977-1819(-)